MEFTPEGKESAGGKVPFCDEVRSQDGWQGQNTTRSIDTLKADVTQAMARVGGVVHGFQRGSYLIEGQDRPGMQVSYSIEGPNGKMVYGRLDIAALPARKPVRISRYEQIMRGREDAALAMALYNVVQALRAQWVLAQLNPAYVPLMAWLLDDKGRTFSELWSSGASTGRLLPPRAGSKRSAIDGKFRDLDQLGDGA